MVIFEVGGIIMEIMWQLCSHPWVLRQQPAFMATQPLASVIAISLMYNHRYWRYSHEIGVRISDSVSKINNMLILMLTISKIFHAEGEHQRFTLSVHLMAIPKVFYYLSIHGGIDHQKSSIFNFLPFIENYVFQNLNSKLL